MTDAADSVSTPRVRRRYVRRPKSGLGWFMLVMVLLVALVAAIGLTGRYGVLTPQGRLLVEARTSGLYMGRLGRLKIEGLGGDIWRDFTIRRLTISDEQGVWLDARDVVVVWRPAELFSRRLHAETVRAGQVQLIRRPTLRPKGVSRELPVSFDIDSLKLTVETLPAFSIRRGWFDLDAEFEFHRRGGGARGKVVALSRTHQGDGLHATFNMRPDQRVQLMADAIEARGGALAGALGLDPDQPFALSARANGTMVQGEFSLATRLGDIVPAEGRGTWNDRSGTGNVRLLLSASTLTRQYARMFGPEAAFDLQSRPLQGETHQIDLRGRSENLTFHAVGPVDLGKRESRAGLNVDLAVGDPNRLVEVPELGAGRFAGFLKGTPSEWTAQGDVGVDRLTLFDYTLARARGPAQISQRRGELIVKADFAGAGGGGRGLFSAWMGASPTVSVDLSRVPGRGYLIRSMAAKGAGMDLKGSGSRGILGGFTFKGDVRLSNLAAARAGASGIVTGTWTASQSRAGRPWEFTADGRAADFGSSFAQADRLLGPGPRLRAAASLQNGVMSFSRLDIDGQRARVEATGTYGRGQAIRFDLDWRADGPFRAGPVEIAGDLRGDGVLSGTMGDPRIAVEANVDAIEFPRLTVSPAHVAASFARVGAGTGGAVRMTGDTQYGQALARADFRFNDDGVDLTGIDARAGGLTAVGSLALRNRQPSRADLVLTLGPGAFITSGGAGARVQIVDGPSGATGSIRLDADQVRLAGSEVIVRSLGLSADGPMSQMPYTVRADLSLPQGPVSLQGRGTASERDQVWAVNFEGAGKVREIDVRTLTPLVVRFGPDEASAVGALAVGGGRADLEARQTGETVAVNARVEGVDLAVASADLAGKISGVLALQGRGSQLSGTMEARLAQARSRDAPAELAIDGVVRANLQGARLNMDLNATSRQGLRSTASAVLPAEASAAPFRIAVNRTRPITGRFDVDGELKPLWDLFSGGARELAGRLTAQGTLGGTINDPEMTGVATLANGRFEDEATGLTLTNVSVAADLDEDVISFRQFTGRDERGGTVTGDGRLSLERGGASSFTLQATRFLLIDNDLGEAQASGRVAVNRGADGRVRIQGALTIDRADIVADPPTPSGVVPMEVVERNKPPGRPESFQAPVSRGPEIALDVDLDAPRRVFVRGRGLDVELSLDAHVGGTTRRPELSGTARVVRGDYEFASKRFEFDESGVVHLASSADRIRLELSAIREDPSLTAEVRIRGTAARPEITLTSIPALPSDEVLSQVLFGRSASQLSPLEAAQLASALASLATGGGFDVIGGLRSLAGLDRLALAGGDESGVSVSGGKYLTDDVYLELTGGGRDGPAAQVEWRVRRNLSIVSRLAGDGDSRLSIRWRRDYGRPAGQQRR